MSTQPVELQSPAARGFLRSLNILLKSARMYGMAHSQTVAQASDAWVHLQAVFAEAKRKGLQLAVSDHRLLVDGLAIKAGPAELSFAQFLDSADLASVSFTAQVTNEAFLEMIRVIAESGSKPEGLADKLKQVLGPEAQCGIAIDEIRFVPAGSEHPEKTVAAQLLANTFGRESSDMAGVLDDPYKLLELISLARGTNTPAGQVTAGTENTESTSTSPGHFAAGIENPAEPGTGHAAGTMAHADASTSHPGESPSEPSEEDTCAVIHLLSQLAHEERSGAAINSAKLQEQVSRLPTASQKSFHQAVNEFVQGGKKRPDTPFLLQVAEHLAVQLALDRYAKGDSRVDAVTDMLNRLNREVETLRQALDTTETKIKQTGFEIARPPDSLEQQFWTTAPDSAKLEVLLSDQAWRVPTNYIKQYLDQLAEQANAEKLQQVLENYVNCIHSSSSEARQKTSHGLKELAGFFPFPGCNALRYAIEHVGDALAQESDARLQKLLTGTFVLLGQEAATRRRYPAILSLISKFDSLETSHPELGRDLRARVGLENRVPNFLDEAIHLPEPSPELIGVLQRMPLEAAEHLATAITRRVRRRDRDRLLRLAEGLGPEAAHALVEAFCKRPPAAAALFVGLLSRLDPVALEKSLLARLNEWNRVYQDMVVRNLAAAGAPGRAMLLAKLLQALDPLVVPLAIDEMGMSGDAATAPLLVAIANGSFPTLSAPYVQLKAIESLGRLRVKEAVPLLQQLVNSKEYRNTLSPKELRVVAAQSLQKIDPQTAKAVLSTVKFTQADLEPIPFDPDNEAPGVRQRYYPRVKLRRALPAKITTADGTYSVAIRQLSLGGGLCSCEHHLLHGTPATIRIKTGLRSLNAKLFLRDSRSEMVAFEIVDIELEERSRLRALLQANRR
ncbi:MAG TPA: HEAT repeat domain-containing protein [Verrucomicrobiae bacterium]|nr:HEAT repeat domain-containing protein [Verrucomicrobiae bacterium]